MGEERKVYSWWESQKERVILEDQGIDGIRMGVREISWGSMEWMQLAQDRGLWWPLVNTVMNQQVLAPRC
jgi:hypothetical protein